MSDVEREETLLLVVPHTHWDREWHHSFQWFHWRLVRVVDDVLRTLEDDPAFRVFMLDGQTIVLEDYLDIRPENAERLRTLARQRRLLVGPWYVQPDEFLVGGESLIRNLLIGRRMAEPYGGAMPIGYVPDTFGHIAQLPQLLRGFGLDNAVFWRGTPPEIEHAEFTWAAPDGSEVIGVWLCHPYGYGNAPSLPLEPRALAAHAQQIAALMRDHVTMPIILLMNGADHLGPQPGLPAALEAANPLLREHGYSAALGTLPQYVQAVRELRTPLPRYAGELRSGYRVALLPDVLSTRMWIKQRNAACETALLRLAEPAAAWAWALGGEPYPAGFLDAAWRHLLRNAPHDSICGTSIDQVHEEMRSRFDQSEQIAEEVTAASLAALARQAETRGQAASTPLVVFNPTGADRSDVVRFEAQLPAAVVEFTDAEGRTVPHRIVASRGELLLDETVEKGYALAMTGIISEGRALDFAIVAAQVTRSTASPATIELDLLVSSDSAPDVAAVERALADLHAAVASDDTTHVHARARRVARSVVDVLAPEVPANGGRVFFVRPARADAHEGEPFAPGVGTLRVGAETLENEHVRVWVNPAAGTLTLTDLASGAVYRGLNVVEDGGDVGDLYNYSPPADDPRGMLPEGLPTLTVAEAGPLRGTLRVERIYSLPAACTPDRRGRSAERVACRVVSEVSLLPGARRVEVRTTVENAARDHRLRVLFPVPFAVESARAEGTFTVEERPARHAPPGPGVPPESAWPELPTDAQPQKRWVAVSDGQHGLAVLNRGLPEYEIVANPDGAGDAVALTLLRCVGWLSRADLTTRKGHAGPMLETPLAQCLGTHTFEYALVPCSGTGDALGNLITREADAYEAPLRAVLAEQHAGTLPPAWSFVRVEPATVAISAIKRAEAGDGVILRLWNTGDSAVRAGLTFAVAPRWIAELRLDETPPGEETVRAMGASGAEVALRPSEIKTVRIRFN